MYEYPFQISSFLLQRRRLGYYLKKKKKKTHKTQNTETWKSETAPFDARFSDTPSPNYKYPLLCLIALTSLSRSALAASRLYQVWPLAVSPAWVTPAGAAAAHW